MLWLISARGLKQPSVGLGCPLLLTAEGFWGDKGGDDGFVFCCWTLVVWFLPFELLMMMQLTIRWAIMRCCFFITRIYLCSFVSIEFFIHKQCKKKKVAAENFESEHFLWDINAPYLSGVLKSKWTKRNSRAALLLSPRPQRLSDRKLPVHSAVEWKRPFKRTDRPLWFGQYCVMFGQTPPRQWAGNEDVNIDISLEEITHSDGT